MATNPNVGDRDLPYPRRLQRSLMFAGPAIPYPDRLCRGRMCAATPLGHSSKTHRHPPDNPK